MNYTRQELGTALNIVLKIASDYESVDDLRDGLAELFRASEKAEILENILFDYYRRLHGSDAWNYFAEGDKRDRLSSLEDALDKNLQGWLNG